MYNQLQTRLHTKEFPGLEVEGKWLLRTCNPVPTILHFVEDVQLDRWYPYVRTKSMGHRSTEVSFLAIQNFFFGFVNKQNAWEQVAMAPKYPGRDLYLLIFKNPPKNTFALENDLFAPIVMMRMEEKKQGLFPYNTLMDHIHARAPNAQ